jgi:P4 family phage/plasmid primase-like protien
MSSTKQGGGKAPDFAREILRQGEHFAQDAGHKLYYFHAGLYRRDGDEHVRRLVKKLSGDEQWSSHLAKEVGEYIRVDAPQLWECPPLEEINVRNGILNVNTKQLRTHDARFLCAVQLPVDFDANATCSEWERQISETFPQDAAQAGVAWEIVAWLMLPDTRIQKSLLLLGDGGTGKSTFLTALTAFLGKENVSHLSLHKLETDRFAVARLVGKLANICADLPSTHLTTSSIFKALTGGDRMSGEYKFGDIFEFIPFARLVFSANQPPRSADASNAFYQRWVVLPLDTPFRGTKDEIDRGKLDARLADPQQLSGVLNRALDALSWVRKNGLTETDSMREAAAQFRAATDPVAIWLERNTVADPSAVTLKAALFQAFNEDSESQGRPPMSDKAFGAALKHHRPGLLEAQRTINGKPKQHCWLGITFRLGNAEEGAGEAA